MLAGGRLNHRKRNKTTKDEQYNYSR